MFKTIGALLVAGLLTGCAGVNPVLERVNEETAFALIESNHTTDEFLQKVFKDADTIIINDGVGGHLDGMIFTLAYLDANPEKSIVIDGACASACTLLLTRPHNVVFTENAVFRFHSARTQETIDGKLVETMSERGNLKMRRLFPESVQEWIDETGAFESLELTDMDSYTARKFFPEMFIRSEDLPELEVYGEFYVNDESILPIVE